MMFKPFIIGIALGSAALLSGSAYAHEMRRGHIGRQDMGRLYHSCTEPNTVAITMDDGPFDYQRDIVDTLNKEGIKATFFVNGNNYRCIYDDDLVSNLRFAHDSGHLIASHTWAHTNLSEQSFDKLHDEMWKVEQAMSRILGVTPAWMRPPYGEYNDMVLQVATQRGQAVVIWDFDSGDTWGISADEMKERYRQKAEEHPNNILTLNHETKSETVYDVLPFAIQQLKDKGYKFVTVSECLGGQPDYNQRTQREEKNDQWHC